MAYEIYVADLAFVIGAPGKFLKILFDLRTYLENGPRMQKIEKSKKSKNRKIKLQET